MTTFEDGPAKGQTLMLHRAPLFLRAVHDAVTGKWDALDQLGDTPKPTERIFCYVLTGPPSHCHIRSSGGRGGFYSVANYRAILPNPLPQEIMRDNKAWADWCETQPIPAWAADYMGKIS